MSMRKTINTADLTKNDIPLADADWHQISLFALSFDYKAEMQMANLAPDIWSFSDSSNLQDLRAYHYHQQVWESIGPRLSAEDHEWLRQACTRP